MLIPQGTQIYDPKAGGWRDLGMLDVMQVRHSIHGQRSELFVSCG